MRLLNFICFYQYFDNLERQLTNRLDILEHTRFDRLIPEDIMEIYDLKMQLKFLRKIYTELSEFILDL